MILIDNQGATHDGGIYDDDPSDDTDLGQAQLGQRRPHLERRLPPRQPARPALHDDRGRRGKVLETAGQVAEGANQAAKGIATMLKWAPYVLAGIGAIGATAVVLAAVKQRTAHPEPTPTVKETTMRQDHPELLTTLRDVAATAVTLLDTFAQIRRERTAQQPPPHPRRRLAGPTRRPTDASARRRPTSTTRRIRGRPRPTRPIRPPTQSSMDEPGDDAHGGLTSNSWKPTPLARPRTVAPSAVGPRTRAGGFDPPAPLEIAELASAAIEGDGLRTLPILDALLERLRDEFRDQTRSLRRRGHRPRALNGPS
jgi:hypothetical protein